MFLENDHTMAGAGRGRVGRGNFLPLTRAEAERPQVVVVMELRLRGRRELAAKHPQLATGAANRGRLVKGARRRRLGRAYSRPLLLFQAVHVQIVVHVDLS